jgi:hypothetical protein
MHDLHPAWRWRNRNMVKALAFVGLSMFAFAVGGVALSKEKAAPEAVIKVILENDKISVRDVRFAPGAVSKMQERPARVVHYLTPGHFTEAYEDGTAKDIQRKSGETVWAEKGTFEARNAGKKAIHLLVVIPK